jgi:hypothetical protein
MIITMLGGRVGVGAVWQAARAVTATSARNRIFMDAIAPAAAVSRQQLRGSHATS